MVDRRGMTAFLMGGWTAEAEISRATAEACFSAAESAGWAGELIEIDRDIAGTLGALRPSRIFNALHGQIGEDGNIQGLLNVMGIPYTHSGLVASAIAMDKPTAKLALSHTDIVFPAELPLKAENGRLHIDHEGAAVIKPRNHGSSVGVVIAGEGDSLPATDHWPAGTLLMAEPYIPGLELTVGVLDGKALTVTEITQSNRFYDYEAKYAAGGSDHQLPAQIAPDAFSRAMEWAEIAHQQLGCRGVSRADFRYDQQNDLLYMLEINTQPGMTETSLVPEQAQFKGISMPELVTMLLESAQCD